METIEIQLTTPIAIALAMSQGWTPTVEDTTQPLVGDNYPMVANPVTYQEFIKTMATPYLSDIVLRGARERLRVDFNSIHDSINHQIDSGQFDEQLLSGEFDAIKQAVKASLD